MVTFKTHGFLPDSYRHCLLKVTKRQQEATFKHHSCLEEMLNYISALVPNDVKGEILEDWNKVSQRPCKMSSNVSLVVSFGRFIGKSLQ